MNAQPISSSGSSDNKAALDEFFAAVRAAARESEAAVASAKPALARIAQAIAGHDNSQALRVRQILLSLYSGGSVLADVSDLLTLDWSLRRDLCAVMLAFNHGEFSYETVAAAFEQAGDRHCRWFLGAAPNPGMRLREALAFAKAGPLTSTPRTLTERGVAEVLLSICAGHRVDLSASLRSLDDTRRSLLTQIFSDFVAGKLHGEDCDAVCEHFGQPE